MDACSRLHRIYQEGSGAAEGVHNDKEAGTSGGTDPRPRPRGRNPAHTYVYPGHHPTP